MKVVDVNWGAWFQLDSEEKCYYCILCQIGRGTNDLLIEWTCELDSLRANRSLTRNQLLEKIIYDYHSYCHLMVSDELVEQIDKAVSEYHLAGKNA